MPLKITRAVEPIRVERLVLCIYGPPGIAKSSLAFTASRPLLLDFDRGSHRAANRKDVVQINGWADAANITAEDLEPYDTVVIDTAGRALDKMSADIIAKDPKKGYGGALNLQGYGVLKSQFAGYLNMLKSFGKDIVLIAHMDEQRSGDEIIERLDVQGSSKQEIYKSADAMGRLQLVKGKRVLNFSPTDAAFGKNPGELDPMEIPHHTKPEFEHFLAGVITQIKDRLNTLTEEQMAAQASLEKWRTALLDVEDADGINALVPDAKKAGPAVTALLHDRATKLGLVADVKAKAYKPAPAKAA